MEHSVSPWGCATPFKKRPWISGVHIYVVMRLLVAVLWRSLTQRLPKGYWAMSPRHRSPFWILLSPQELPYPPLLLDGGPWGTAPLMPHCPTPPSKAHWVLLPAVVSPFILGQPKSLQQITIKILSQKKKSKINLFIHCWEGNCYQNYINSLALWINVFMLLLIKRNIKCVFSFCHVRM